jgi:hypothetical protein
MCCDYDNLKKIFCHISLGSWCQKLKRLFVIFQILAEWSQEERALSVDFASGAALWISS